MGSCNGASEVASVSVEGADLLEGAITPRPASDGSVEFGPEAADGIGFGEVVTVEFDASGWDESWVELRREKQGEVWESVTCNTTGLSSFTIDDTHWSRLSTDLTGTFEDVVVAFQLADEIDLDSGQRAEVLTRALSRASSN
jgi:hypothetical protein